MAGPAYHMQLMGSDRNELMYVYTHGWHARNIESCAAKHFFKLLHFYFVLSLELL
jgi:hypothetical protein